MITKEGISTFNKKGFILPVVGAHITQNALVRRLLKSGRFNSHLMNSLAGNLGRVKGSSVSGNIAFGGLNAAVPEAGILKTEIGNIGTKLKESLIKNGIDPNTLNKRDLVTIRRAMRGDIIKAAIGKSPNSSKLVESLLESLPSDKKYTAALALGSLNKGSIVNALAPVEKALKDSELYSNLGSGMAKSMSKVRGGALSDSKAKKVQGLSEVAAYVPLLMAEPATGAVNVGKRLLFSEKAKYTALGKPLTYLKNKIVSEPSKARFSTGLEGSLSKKGLNSPLGKKIDRYGFNYLNSEIKSLSGNLGKSLAPTYKKGKPLIDLVRAQAQAQTT